MFHITEFWCFWTFLTLRLAHRSRIYFRDVQISSFDRRNAPKWPSEQCGLDRTGPAIIALKAKLRPSSPNFRPRNWLRIPTAQRPSLWPMAKAAPLSAHLCASRFCPNPKTTPHAPAPGSRRAGRGTALQPAPFLGLRSSASAALQVGNSCKNGGTRRDEVPGPSTPLKDHR